MARPSVIRRHELAFLTQYAELKERVRGMDRLLPGTPGSLTLRTVNGSRYWYRTYYPVPGKVAEDYVCGEGDVVPRQDMAERIEMANWVVDQVRSLRKLGFQVGTKHMARVLVELHNSGLMAGFVLVGTQAYMATLNELGAVASSAMTLDLDLGVNRRDKHLKLGARLTWQRVLENTRLPFVPVPELNASRNSATVKLPGVEGFRVDLLTHGRQLGALVRIPALDWEAQTIPFFEYLLADPEPAAVLAGGHCIPVQVPQFARFVWHKLYSSRHRRGFREKAVKDLNQAMTLAEVLHLEDPRSLVEALHSAPPAMRKELREWLPRSLSGRERTFLGDALDL